MKCPKCQMNVSDNSVCCLHCGFQFKNQYETFQSTAVQNVPNVSNPQVIQNDNYVQNTTSSLNQGMNTIKKKDGVPSKNVVFMVLAIVNMLLIFPGALTIILAWLIFGALGGTTIYYIGLLISAIYVLGSIIAFPLSIWNVAKYNETSKKSFAVCSIAFVLIFAILFGCIKLFPNQIADLTERVKEQQKAPISKDESQLLFENEDIEIDVNRVRHDSGEKHVEIEFTLKNNSYRYYSFNIRKAKANDQDILFFTDSGSNFHSINNMMIEPGGSSDNYVMYINDSELEKKNLSYYRIDKISLQLILYYMEDDSPNVEHYELEEYYDIEL